MRGYVAVQQTDWLKWKSDDKDDKDEGARLRALSFTGARVPQRFPMLWCGQRWGKREMGCER
jgi:hypothetical protein